MIINHKTTAAPPATDNYEIIMEILEKPADATEWFANVSCHKCYAKLKIDANDLVYQKAHTAPDWDRLKTNYWSDHIPDVDVSESFHVSCPVCKTIIQCAGYIFPPWPVMEFIKQKQRNLHLLASAIT